MSPFIRKLLRAFGLRRWSGPNQFDEVPKIALGVPLEEALQLYGEPFERKVNDEFPPSNEYGFLVTDRIDVKLWEWQGRVHAVTFWAREWEDEREDLQFILDGYGEGLGWDVLGAGYLYGRKDEQVLLHCSAMPWIGVKTSAYSQARGAFKAAGREANESQA